MGATRPFFLTEEPAADMTTVYAREQTLREEIAPLVEGRLPGVEVLAVELVSPSRFCVYVDHANGVDHALCESVTEVLRPYLDRFSIEVSSPGPERPLRTQRHFAAVVGCRAAIRTDHDVRGRNRFRGEVVAADEDAVMLGVNGSEPLRIPYGVIVRGNLIDERLTT
jgi:ribosome maturation factor RimP